MYKQKEMCIIDKSFSAFKFSWAGQFSLCHIFLLLVPKHLIPAGLPSYLICG